MDFLSVVHLGPGLGQTVVGDQRETQKGQNCGKEELDFEGEFDLLLGVDSVDVDSEDTGNQTGSDSWS